jgi:hypothetical protein
MPTCTLTRCPPSRFPLSQNVQQFCLLLLCTYALAQCPYGRDLRILSDYAFFFNSQQSSFLCAPLYTRSMPTWQNSTELLRDSVFCLQTLSRVLPSMHHSTYAQCPLGRALQNPQQNSVCNYVSLTQPYLQGIQQP